MTFEELQASLDEVQTILDEKFAIVREAQKVAGRVNDKKNKILAKMRELKSNDLSYILFDIDAFSEMNKLLPYPEISTFGYWPEDKDTGQSRNEQCLQIAVKYDTMPSKEAIEFIETWMKISEKKMMRISRFDHCMTHSMIIDFTEDGFFKVFDDRGYSRKKFEFRTSVMEELFRHISLNHYSEEQFWDRGEVEDDF